MKGFLISLGSGFAVLLIFVLGALFDQFINLAKSSGGEIAINEYVQASISSKPDLYSSNPSFYATNLSDEDKGAVNTAFAAILELVKASEHCSGGSYQTTMTGGDNPRLRLSSRLKCEFDANKLQAYNKLINSIDEVIKNSPVKMHLSAIIPSFSDEKKEQNEASLKKLIFEKIAVLENGLSERFSKHCMVKNVAFDGANSAEFEGFNMPRANAMMLSASNDSSASITAPQLSDIKVQMGANVSFVCK